MLLISYQHKRVEIDDVFPGGGRNNETNEGLGYTSSIQLS